MFAVVSSTLFYLVTNAGVWLQGYYAPGLSGLVASLAAGLPFYKTMLLGNLVFVPLTVASYQVYAKYQPSSRMIVHYLTNLTYYRA